MSVTQNFFDYPHTHTHTHTQLANQFNSKLDAYFQRVGEVSHTMKQGAWQAIVAASGDGVRGDGHSPSWSETSSSDSSDNAMY